MALYTRKDSPFHWYVVEGTDIRKSTGIPIKGFPAKVVTRGYHLLSMPGNRVRVAGDWLLDSILGRHGVQLGLVRGKAVPLDTDSSEA